MTKKFKRKRYILFSFLLLNNPSFFELFRPEPPVIIKSKFNERFGITEPQSNGYPFIRNPLTTKSAISSTMIPHQPTGREIPNLYINTNFYGFARRKTSAFDSQRTQKIESSNFTTQYM